ncbi:ferric reductase NAD binding domain-containing protein [Daldinia decipiens]|uniref:ferric reductase NAD binding domain-containing protein n=1 Tax=Daldinia decipiens TaxID=326647 RepID=UPI0020C2C9C2|nr:ferric reductase NAD binding domain-containing protein [Daldinia decipiens]KAI1653320.1 ferric reductase NAD binding domain-containing protein [Daldinia decipiens]
MSSPTSGTASAAASESSAAAAAAAAEAAAFYEYIQDRHVRNEKVLVYYAAGLSSLIGLFIIGHWLRLIAVRLGWSRNPIFQPLIAIARVSRRIFIQSVPGFTSIGHAAVVTAYVALNVLFSFYNVNYSMATDLCARFGWMATGNMVLVVFLALKNTPLAIFTAYSYERLNGLHQIAGYTTLVYTILHGSIYSAYFLNQGFVYVLQLDIVTAGIILGFALLFSVLAGAILRHFHYESFYVVHLALFIVIVVTMGLHRPNFDPDKTLYATVIIGALWFSDRLIRFCRLVYNSINNEATVYPLPNGGTRIVLKKPLLRARPGKHCYVWLPRIRTFETHPFTIVASEPMELIINTYSGFTRALHQYALNNPGARLKVSVEGPYGTLPDPMDFDRVVLVAGGSGATFTFGMAADMLARMSEDSKQRIDFIWAVKGHENLTWFTQQLQALSSHVHAPKVALKLHITRMASASPTSRDDSIERRSASVTSTDINPSSLEKGADHSAISVPGSSTATRDESDKDEKDIDATRHIEIPSTTTNTTMLPIIHGRPDTAAEIRAAVESLDKDQRVLIAACGPSSLINIVRDIGASYIKVDGPAVEIHCEQFGW